MLPENGTEFHDDVVALIMASKAPEVNQLELAAALQEVMQVLNTNLKPTACQLLVGRAFVELIEDHYDKI